MTGVTQLSLLATWCYSGVNGYGNNFLIKMQWQIQITCFESV